MQILRAIFGIIKKNIETILEILANNFDIKNIDKNKILDIII